jgi:exo-beta-1,3-glucanase (GH17 family)
MRVAAATLSLLCAAVALAGCGSPRREPAGADGPPTTAARQEPFVTRELRLLDGARWLGNGIAYGPHRDGQRPGGPDPTPAEVREDLALLAPRWQWLRLYGASGPAENALQGIRADRRDLRVMLGVWIDAEAVPGADGRDSIPLPAARAGNRREIEAAVRLAAEYPEIVSAICVGNETQIFWSSHRVPAALLIGYVREARARIALPVSVADDFNFWNKPESRSVAREADFLVTHMHPLWNGQPIAEALPWTQRTFAAVRAAHPDAVVVLGETGWATRKHDVGEQATLIKGRPGEAEQKAFFEAVTAWTTAERIPLFYFEAFDEKWKGGDHPDEVEKHWGLFRADRSPKPAVAGGV